MLVAAGIGGARAISHGGEGVTHDAPAIFRSGDEIGRGIPPIPKPKPVPIPGDTREQIAETLARGALCDAIGDLYDPESPGTITRGEILDNVASHVTGAAGVPVYLVRDAAGELLAAQNIAEINPRAAYEYVRNCPFL